MPAARTTSTLIRNAIEAATDAGLVIGAVEVTKGGTVRIISAGAQNVHPDEKRENTCAALFSEDRD